jgi:hypothetical protein
MKVVTRLPRQIIDLFRLCNKPMIRLCNKPILRGLGSALEYE